MSDIGTNILAGTVAEMTWFEIEAAAREGAILLWAFGVIEQHGPHLPTGTDVYLPMARLRMVKDMLAEHGVRALIVPPYYWGVNVVSGAFPSSYRVRPELMRELMADVFASLETDGFGRVFCFSGHGDALHNKTICEGIALGRERTGMDISFVIEDALAQRLGLSRDDPRVALRPTAAPPDSMQVAGSSPSASLPGAAPSRFLDVHAGEWETSIMMEVTPSLVHEEARRGLAPTNYGPDDLAEWRKGFEHARRKTPMGYFGAPADASAEQGRELLRESARNAVEAILARLQRS
ncbi:MAG: creatininase family protein [Pigmentiphaga sp.]|uniref:creatininase family protein n=1 Tax=Pigmentiphaga sp. TaxID=1977564 RepID=UPI0029BE9AAD|nr:creatininase family protein [Pigmentiphaga sp.]MDX3905898.1 creatininase family protein [Pigmentiphaga sp.]